jgi:hypothetical protein
MASTQQITDELAALEAVYPFRVARSPEQYVAWLNAYIEDLRPYDIEVIRKACRSWRQTGTKFPLLADLLPLVRNSAPKTATRVETWRPASEAEYQAMSILEKRRECMLLGQEAHDRAVREAIRAGWGRNVATVPEAYVRWMAVADGHFAEAKRLFDLKASYRDAA